MDHILYILRDDDFDTPIFAGVPIDDLDEELWNAVMELVHDAVENEGPRNGFAEIQDHWIGWRHLARSGVSFVAILEEEYDKGAVDEFLCRVVHTLPRRGGRCSLSRYGGFRGCVGGCDSALG